MDMYSMYMPDALSYSALRSPVYRDYEIQPFEQKYVNNFTAKPQKPVHKSKDGCPFCKEQKRRPLVAYLRGKANQQTQNTIIEEHEHEHEEDEEQTPQNENDKQKGNKPEK